MSDNEERKETADDKSGAMGNITQGEMKHLDFITSIVLMILSIAVIPVSYGYYEKSKKAFYASPGFVPIIIAGALFFLGLSLMFQSLNNSSLREIVGRLREALPRGLKSLRFRNTVIGLVIFAVYIYAGLRFLPFWLASILLLFVCFVFLKASKLIYCIIISVLSVGGILLLFQVAFRVPMP
jgi:hypothetical protein